WGPADVRSVSRNDNYRWRAYYRWRPALVGFFDAPSPHGHYIGWYPLAPGQRWRRPDADHSHLQYPSARDSWRRPGQSTFIQPPQNGRGVALLPVGGCNRAYRPHTLPRAPQAEISNQIKQPAPPGLPASTPR